MKGFLVIEKESWQTTLHTLSRSYVSRKTKSFLAADGAGGFLSTIKKHPESSIRDAPFKTNKMETPSDRLKPNL